MRKTWGLIAFAAAMLLSACAQLPQAELTKDEHAVYASILSGTLSPDSEIEYVIVNETLCCSHTSISDDYAFDTLSVTKEILAAYRAANQQSWLIKPELGIPVRYTLVSQAQLDKILSNNSMAGWRKFSQLYPQAPGYITVSRIGFDPQRAHALMWVEVHGGPKTYFSSICTPHKSGSEWVQGTCYKAP